MWVAAVEDAPVCSAVAMRARTSRLPLRKPPSARKHRPKYAAMKPVSNAKAPAQRDPRGQPHAKHVLAAGRCVISKPCSASHGHAQRAMDTGASFPIHAANAKVKAA